MPQEAAELFRKFRICQLSLPEILIEAKEFSSPEYQALIQEMLRDGHPQADNQAWAE